MFRHAHPVAVGLTHDVVDLHDQLLVRSLAGSLALCPPTLDLGTDCLDVADLWLDQIGKRQRFLKRGRRLRLKVGILGSNRVHIGDADRFAVLLELVDQRSLAHGTDDLVAADGLACIQAAKLLGRTGHSSHRRDTAVIELYPHGQAALISFHVGDDAVVRCMHWRVRRSRNDHSLTRTLLKTDARLGALHRGAWHWGDVWPGKGHAVDPAEVQDVLADLVDACPTLSRICPREQCLVCGWVELILDRPEVGHGTVVVITVDQPPNHPCRHTVHYAALDAPHGLRVLGVSQ